MTPSLDEMRDAARDMRRMIGSVRVFFVVSLVSGILWSLCALWGLR